MHHLQETPSHLLLLTRGAHLATRTATRLVRCTARIYLGSACAELYTHITWQCLSPFSARTMLTYRDQQCTTATREQGTRNVLNHATKHIPTILAQPDAGLHCKYPAFSSFFPAHWPQTRTRTRQTNLDHHSKWAARCRGTRPKVVGLRKE